MSFGKGTDILHSVCNLPAYCIETREFMAWLNPFPYVFNDFVVLIQ